jgi:exosortase A
MKITDRRFIALFVLLLVSWALVYQDALLGMENIWRRSDTFAHGYFILPICLWLMWRDKEYLLSTPVQSSWLPVPILFGSLFVWLLAFAASINVLGQLSAVVSFIALISILIGNQLTWRYKFPLAYLLFAVPMGENLIPILQEITAWFTVYLLKLTGMPVFSDGLYIQIPSGLFEVAVACSGIRYLIASITVGTLFAYLTYNSTKKQIIFILFSILMPIVANGIRAYGIVAIAHYSEMKYAKGFDHLIYGWLFFGLVIMFMFWVGGKFADKEVLTTSETKSLKAFKNNDFFAMSALFMLISMLFILDGVETVAQPRLPTPSLTVTDNITKVDQSDWGITFEQGLQRSHVINADKLEVFRAVYANKQSQGELISGNNALFDAKDWSIIQSKEIDFVGATARYILLKSPTGKERAVLYWFSVLEKHLVDRAKVILMQAFGVYRAPESTAEIIAFSLKNLTEEEMIVMIAKFLPILAEIKINPGNIRERDK